MSYSHYATQPQTPVSYSELPPATVPISQFVSDILAAATELQESMLAAKRFLVGEDAANGIQSGQSAPAPGDLTYRLAIINKILADAICNKNRVLQALGL